MILTTSAGKFLRVKANYLNFCEYFDWIKISELCYGRLIPQILINLAIKDYFQIYKGIPLSLQELIKIAVEWSNLSGQRLSYTSSIVTNQKIANLYRFIKSKIKNIFIV